MNSLEKQTVAQIVCKEPKMAAVFEGLGIDFCCGGDITLAEACNRKALTVADVIELLKAAEGESRGESRDWAGAGISELIENIVGTHHAFLNQELPRLSLLLKKVDLFRQQILRKMKNHLKLSLQFPE